MEGHCRDLETDSGNQQDDRELEARVALVAGENRRHRAQVGRAGQAVHQRHSVEQDAERKGAEQKILHRRFVRTLTRLDETGQDVERHGHRLEADEDGDEIDPAGHDHHAQRRAQNQEVVLTRRRAFDGEIAHRHQHGDTGGQQEDDLEEQRESIHRDQAARHLDVGGRERCERPGRRRQHDERHPAERGPLRPRQHDVGDQHQQRAGGDDQLRQDVIKVAD